MPLTVNKSSYSVFGEVDRLVSKPILGSDGAASWQQWKQSDNNAAPASRGAAPHLPFKKLDRVGIGMKSLREEREREKKVRREAGDAELGKGYTEFKKKFDAASAAEKKRIDAVLQRVRPDHVRYFLGPKETFEGYKEDYIFTTRDGRGTGYYWDGMDAYRKQTGKTVEAETVARVEEGDEPPPKKKKKKKMKKKSIKDPNGNGNDDNDDTPKFISDPNNPLEQVANAIKRRNEALLQKASQHNSEGNSSNWSRAVDPLSGRTYYFNKDTGETRWEDPLGKVQNGKVETENVTLPAGWKATMDAQGKEYYYNAQSGKTQWDRPK